MHLFLKLDGLSFIWSKIHGKLYVYTVWGKGHISFFFNTWLPNFSSTICWKDFPLSHWITLALSKINSVDICGSISRLCVVSHWLTRPLLCQCLCMLSYVWPFATPWTVSCQALLSLEISSQEYWSGLSFSTPGVFPTQGSNPHLLCVLPYHCTTWETCC